MAPRCPKHPGVTCFRAKRHGGSSAEAESEPRCCPLLAVPSWISPSPSLTVSLSIKWGTGQCLPHKTMARTTWATPKMDDKEVLRFHWGVVLGHLDADGTWQMWAFRGCCHLTNCHASSAGPASPSHPCLRVPQAPGPQSFCHQISQDPHHLPTLSRPHQLISWSLNFVQCSGLVQPPWTFTRPSQT